MMRCGLRWQIGDAKFVLARVPLEVLVSSRARPTGVRPSGRES